MTLIEAALFDAAIAPAEAVDICWRVLCASYHSLGIIGPARVIYCSTGITEPLGRPRLVYFIHQ